MKAWWNDLGRWVLGLRAAYPHLWPEHLEDTVARFRRRPFLRCWRQHAGLVSDLTVLRTWHDGLRDGAEWAGGVQGYHEWRVFLDRIADDLQVIAPLCTPRHRDGILPLRRAGGEGIG